MRLGIFSDVHANLEAMSSVMEAYGTEDIDTYYCLGDVVGYGGSPNECADIVRDVAVRLAWAANDFARTSFEVRAIVDVSNAELIGEAVLKRQLRFIHDDLRLELSGQRVRPDEDDGELLSRFPDPSRVDVRLQWDY